MRKDGYPEPEARGTAEGTSLLWRIPMLAFLESILEERFAIPGEALRDLVN